MVIFQEVKTADGVMMTMHAYPNKIPRMTEGNDGADIFKIKTPSFNGRVGTVSLESIKFPNYFITANATSGNIRLRAKDSKDFSGT